MPDEANDESPQERSSSVEPSPESAGQQLAVRAEATSFSGPLPHPAILKAYDELVPGAAERLIGWAEEEGRHQREMDRRRLEGAEREQAALIADQAEERKLQRRGQWFGLTIALVGVGVGGLLAALGHTIPASALLGTTVLGLAAVFVTGRYLQYKDEEEAE